MSDLPTNAAPPLVAPGTAPGLEGYFYQLDVSILIALELVLVRQVAPSVVLEPVDSKEDLELDVDGEPQLLAQNVAFEKYRLVVQCKLRNTGPWKVREISSLLTHGTRRPSAATRLADERVRYLLVTNADLDGVARGVRVTEIGTWPNASEMPKDVATVLPATAPGRVAVLSVMDEEKIAGRVNTLLSERFRVSRADLETCRKDLRDEAFLRMRGVAGGSWTRDDLGALIVKHGGFAGRAEALEGFVPPKNWNELQQILASQHAIILTGPSGTGKTRTAQALIACLRDEVPGIAVCELKGGGPEKIRYEQRRPVVFDIEDPWGRYQRGPDAIAWNDSIHPLLQGAGPERKFVITSRSDVLEDSGPKGLRAKFMARLEPQNYGRAERARLFHSRRKRLPGRLQLLVLRHWGNALPELETPLEFERYVQVLAQGMQEGEHEYEYFHRCLREAQQGSIERSILFNVQQRDAYRWAAILWGLFKATPTQTFSTLPLIQASLTQKDLAFEDGLAPYVNFLVAGHNLRQSGPDLTYSHPRVELGLQQAMQSKPGLSARVLKALAETLIELGKMGQIEWGCEGAVRLVAAGHGVEGVSLTIEPAEQAEIDAWIYSRLSSPGEGFHEDLRLAAQVGSSHCAAAELARWLTHRSQAKFGLDVTWRLPVMTPEWVATVRADPATPTICATFVRRMLARDYGFYQENFAREIQKLASPLGPAFRDAARDNAEYGYTSNADAIAYGALGDLDAFEPILTLCLDHLAQLSARVFDDEWLALKDGYYDDEAAEHFEQSLGEAGHTAGQFVAAYVIARRGRTGWKDLHCHPRRTDLLSNWMRAVREDANASDAEWQAVAASTMGTHCEADFWADAILRVPSSFSGMARLRLTEGDADEASRVVLAEFLARQLAAETADIVHELQRRDVATVLEVACNLGNAARVSDDPAPIISAIERVATAVSAPLSDAVRIAAGVASTPPNDAHCTIWRALESGDRRHLRLCRARSLAACGEDTSSEIEELLKPRRDSQAEIDFAASAVDVAIQCEMWRVVEGALKHRFAAVRLRAMSALSSQMPDSLPPSVLACAADKSHTVRVALVELLKQRPDAAHTDALVALAADTWTPDLHMEGRHIRCPIAEAAAEVLCRPPLLEEKHSERLLRIAQKMGSERVTQALFVALVYNGTAESRAAVLTCALEGDTAAVRHLAAEALIVDAQHVESALVARVTEAHLVAGPLRAAFVLSMLVGARANASQAIAAGRAIAAVPDRRVLLIPLYLALREQDANAAKTILALLPGSLAGALERAAQNEAKLPREALAPLMNNSLAGEILATEALDRLSLIFEELS